MTGRTEGEVFVVDDNPHNLGLLTSILRDAGYHVRMLNSSRRALAALLQHPPELVMLDVNMPDMDGYELCRALKADPRTRDVPVIFLSALDEVADKLQAFTAGGVDYVTKPFHPEEVLARVETQVSLSRLRRSLEENNRELEARNRELTEAYRANERMFAQVARLLPGSILDEKYRIEEQIGEGGFAIIYRGVHLALSRPVAIKVLRPDAGPDGPQLLERFRREGISATRVQHPNAVSVLDSGVTNAGVAYLVMELLTGRSLADELEAEGTLSLGRCALLLAPVCAVLAESHAAGIVHRDVKPANVFIHQGPGGEVVKVVDFGIATLFGDAMKHHDRLTTLGRIVGTPLYMSPEQLLGRALDDRADVYSVGVLLYQMIAGRLPIVPVEETLGATILACVHQEPTPLSQAAPGVPASVEQAVMEALAKKAAARPTVEQLAHRFADAIAGHERYSLRKTRGPELAPTVDAKDPDSRS